MTRRLAAWAAFGVLAVDVTGTLPVAARLHAGLGYGVTALALVVALVCFRFQKQYAVPRSAGAVAVGAAAMECIPGAAMIHACFAPVLFAAFAVIALFQPETEAEAEPLPPGFQGSLMVLPPLVLLQITSGAAFRHKLLGVMPHMGSALLVACDLLVACTMALRDYSGRPRLRSAAAGAIAVVLLQVALGITTFVLLLADMDGALVTRFAAGAHICGGALTLAASVRLSLCAAGTGGS